MPGGAPLRDGTAARTPWHNGFGPALRGAGYDAILVRGVAPKPVYLYVDAERAELRDASALWGLDTVATEEAIAQATAADVRVACIGPSGEKQSLISCIINEFLIYYAL